MKTLFIHAKSDIDIIPLIKKVRFKGKLGLVTTIQHLHKLKEVQEVLKGAVVGGQVLGCNVNNAKKITKEVDAFLFIGSGEFHPLQVALETKLPVIIANPFSGKISEVNENDIIKREKRIKGMFLKYLMADKVGILVSTKPGQGQLKKALEFKKGLQKESFIFLFNTLNFNELENYPDISCWVNTACSRIALEDYKKLGKPIINLSDILRLKRA